MPFEAALLIAFFILLATVIGILIFVGSRRQAAKDEEMKRAASARGWQFEGKTERGRRVQRWRGTTDGVSWEAESVIHVSGGSHGKKRQHIGRWHGAWSPGINGPIVAMGLPKGKEELTTTIAEGDGFFARLAQKAVGFAFDKAIGVYFGDGPGKEVDAGAMQRVATQTPGFVILAADKEEGARILSQGLERALVEAAGDHASVLSTEQHRPWILLRPHAISLARMERFRDTAEIERFVRAGIALTRVFKFGRR